MRRLLLIAMLIVFLAGTAAGGGLLYVNSRIGAGHLLAFVNEMVLDRAGLRLEWREAKGSFLFNLLIKSPALVSSSGDTMMTVNYGVMISCLY